MRSLERAALACAVVAAVAWLPAAVPAWALELAAPPGAECEVVAVPAVTSLSLRCGGGLWPARLAGVTAPRPGGPLEGGEPHGDDSLAAVRELLLGRRVVSGRGTVYLHGRDVRLELLDRGLVQRSAAGGDDAPLAAAEAAARRARRGIWSHEVWRRHQTATTRPLDLPAPAQPAPQPLGALAERLAQRTPEERRRAFAAALAALEPADPEVGGASRRTAGAEADPD